ncbi:MAG TPA: MFS transporter [Steroidobacteraceae bacterium]|nr:MFS transporter [Steroidobacteraceae bacterium]
MTPPDLLGIAYKRRFIVILFFVCLFNLGDRAVFSVTAPAIRAELGMNDFQIGILQGFCFALLYGGLGIPIGRLAERYRRTRIIAMATAVWSLATVLTGLAGSLVQMMLARVAVGMGEAGFTAPTTSLVADHFPPRQRASAMSVIWLGLPAGTLVGAIGGGMIAQAYGWRMAFFALGIPGIIVAIIAWFALREPPRGLADGGKPRTGPVPPFRDVMLHIVRVRTLRHVMLGAGICTIGVQGVAQFMPLMFTRMFSMPIGKAALLFGLISGASLTIGLLLGAFGTDRASLRDERWPAWGPTIALLITPLFYMAGFSQTAIPLTAVLLIGGGILAMVYYGPSLGMLQNLVPSSMRASAAAVFGMMTALVGTGVGPTFVGFASDRIATAQFTGGNYLAQCAGPAAGRAAELQGACAQAALIGLRYAIILSVLSFAWAAVHYYLASRSLRADLAAARQS